MKKWMWFLLLFLFVLGCKIESKQNEVLIKDVAINRLDDNNISLSFYIKNVNNSAADCFANISIGENEIHKDIGVIEAMAGKKGQFTLAAKNEEVPVEIKPICRWIDESTSQKCSGGSYIERRICEWVLKKPELQHCLADNVTYYQLFCIALSSKNPKICDYIRSNSRRNWCRAYVTEDSSFCNNILDEKWKDWCYADLGMNLKDSSLCDKVISLKSKNSCIAVITSNPQLCLQGSEGLKISCITNIAESTSNRNICELLGEQKQECFEQK